MIGDSPRAASYAGMRTRRKILAVMALSGAIAGIGGASQDGDFRHTLDPRGLTAAGYGYAGIVIAALARYNPFAVCLIAFLLGGLQNAGYALQGADFPSGLVGVMQGLILFCVLGGELLVRYRFAFDRHRSAGRRRPRDSSLPAVNDSILVVVLASAVVYGTPLLYAALGELLTERSGVLNLGVEGMMLVGAVMGFWARAAHRVARGRGPRRRPRGRPWRYPCLSRRHLAREPDRLGSRADDLRGCGRPFVVPRQRPQRRRSACPALVRSVLPDAWRHARVLGAVVFDQSVLVYTSWIFVILVALYLGRTRPA